MLLGHAKICLSCMKVCPVMHHDCNHDSQTNAMTSQCEHDDVTHMMQMQREHGDVTPKSCQCKVIHDDITVNTNDIMTPHSYAAQMECECH